MSKSIWRLRIGEGHLLDNLALDLYSDPAACLWELVRNGAVACMQEGGDAWEPGVGHVEILLTTHPIAPGVKSLVILDHGSGFTKPAIARYSTLGGEIDERKSRRGTHGGAAQKRIGRFAGLALCRDCAEKRDPNAGFYIYTRTAPRGAVTFAEMIPAAIARDQGISNSELDPSDSALGFLRGVKGSFTAILIPNPVLTTYDEIRNGLLWRIPRKEGGMFQLLIDGKSLKPPALATKLVRRSVEGDIEVFVDRIDKSTAESRGGGIWICDLATGLPVANAIQLVSHLPYPLWHAELTGDIFVPDALAHQDTSRTGFRAAFLRGKTWIRARSYLVGQVAELAKGLLNEEDIFRTKNDALIQAFAEECHRLWGVPEGDGSLDDSLLRPKSGTPKGDKRTPSPRTSPSPGGGGERERKPSFLRIRIMGEDYILNKRRLDDLLFAQVDLINPRVVWLNLDGYEAFPANRERRYEHAILKVLEAIGTAKHPSDPVEVSRFVAQVARELKTTGKRRA